MDGHGSHTLTRRAFVAGAAGGIASLLLPAIPGTDDTFPLPLGPTDAWGEELSAGTRALVVGRSQLGIAVADAATEPLRSVEGATVTVTSLYNGKQASATTDESGSVLLDIAELAEETSQDSPEADDANAGKLEYCFNGRIVVERAGYRDVVIPRVRLRSVSALIVPTRTLDQTRPYLRQLSFDDWDIQYTRATFMRSAENRGTHRLAAEAWIPNGRSLKLRAYYEKADGGTADIGTQTLRANGSCPATASFEEAFLDPAYPAKVLPEGCTLHISMEYDGTTYDQVTGLEIRQAPFEGDTSGDTVITPGVIFSDDEDLNLFTMPDSLPKPLGGSTFSIWKPSFPVLFDFSPLGYVMFGIKLGSLTHVDDKGLLDKDGWKSEPRESAGKQFDRVCAEQSEAIENVRKMGSSPDGSGKSKAFDYECSSEIKIRGGAQAFAELAYDWDSKEWTGALSAVVGAGVDGQWTVQMVIVTVPVYIMFEVGAALNAGLRFGMRSYGPSLDALVKNATYDTSGSNVSVTLEMSVGLSLGVGVADVLCAYIRGAGYISTCAAFYQASPSQSSPRLTVGVGLSASVGVQFLLFKWSGPLWAQDWPCVYDSNDPGGTDAVATLAANDSLPLDANGMPTFDTFARDMSIVTNEELLGVREFEGSPTPSVAALAQDEESEGGAAENDGENDAVPQLEPIDLGDGNLAWHMPELRENDDEPATYAASDSPEYLGASGTGADPSEGIGVSGLSDDPRGGIRPSADTLVFHDVFSDTRMKTIVYQDGSYLFRLASVGYGDEARSRLVYSASTGSSWSDPHVVSFDVYGVDGIARQDLYDYDLAVTQVGFWGTYLYVLLISGTRPQGDGTSFATANSKTVISLLRLYSTNDESEPLRVSSAVSWSPKTSSARCATFSMPTLQAYEDRDSYDRETNSCVIGACLVSSAKKPEDLVKPSASRYVMGLFFEHRRNEAPVVITKTAKVPSQGINRLVLGPIAFDTPLTPAVRAERRHACLGCVTTSGCLVETIGVETADNDAGFALSFTTAVGPADGADVQRLYATGCDGEFYALRRTSDAAADASGIRYDARLSLASFDPADNGAFTFKEIGPDICVPTELAVSKDGRYLYYLVNKEGKTGQEFSDMGDAGEATSDSSYRVMALARVGGLFTKPFTLCELDHPVDFVVSLTTSGTTATLLASTVTDAENSRADIYDIRVPLVVCATPLSLAPEGPFAFAGERSAFNVRIRNDGNTIVRSVTLRLYDAQTGQVADTTTLELGEDVLVAAAGDADAAAVPYDLDGLDDELAASPLAQTGGQGLLAPGMTMTYRAEFEIPAGWSGEKTLRVGIDNGATAIISPEVSAMKLDADDASDNPFEDLSDEDLEWLAFLLALVMALYEDPYNEFDISEDEQPRAEVSVVDAQAFANYSDLIALGESDQTSKRTETGGSSSQGGTDADGPGSQGGSGTDGSGSQDGPAKALPDTGDDGPLGMLAHALGVPKGS